MAAEPRTPEAVEHAAEAVEHAAEFDPGGMIMHHILDSNEIEIPFFTDFTGKSLHLPEIHLFGQDFSITKLTVMMWIVAVGLLFMFWRAAKRSHEPVPRGFRNFAEIFILYIRDEVARKCIGEKDGDRYLPYLLTTFFFILGCNLLGLIPGGATATGAISVTATLALISFLVTQMAGIRNYGLGGHIKNLVPHGLPKAILPIIIPVEILGMFTKPFALAIRLFANMTAGHVVILSLVSFVFILKTPFVAIGTVPFSLFIGVLELLVAVIQAFIFTMLTALFIGMSAHPAH
ncbi:MAG: F0F1 ATP synthase subunit A [Planctomycetota bacterium]|nr:F0F1 ATP synthase subunit A [Planctomycetota bacterium]